MHPNDTLRGFLFQFERPEERHLRHKFGYWKMVQDRAACALAACYGLDLGLFDLSHIHDAIHRHDVTYRETSAAFSARATKAPPAFDREELERIAEHFAGANDPVAASILAKTQARLTAGQN